jgi:hypothetical protein
MPARLRLRGLGVNSGSLQLSMLAVGIFALTEGFLVPHPLRDGLGERGNGLPRPLSFWQTSGGPCGACHLPPNHRRFGTSGLSLSGSPADGLADPRARRRTSGMSHGGAGQPAKNTARTGEAGTKADETPSHHFFSAAAVHAVTAQGGESAAPAPAPTPSPAPFAPGAAATSGKRPGDRSTMGRAHTGTLSAQRGRNFTVQSGQGERGKRPGDRARTGRAFGAERGRNFMVESGRRGRNWGARGGKAAPGDARSESLKQVVERGGSLQAGYQVLDRMLEKEDSNKPSAKFFSLLMSLCVANIRMGRATLADAYGVMQRCRDCGAQPDTIVFNALLAAVSQEAGRGRATLADATSVMRQLRAEGLHPDVRTMNTLMDVTAKVAGAVCEQDLLDDEPAPITPMSGQSILRLMSQEGLQPNVWTYTSLLSMYAKCAARGPRQTSLEDAAKVRKEMAAAGVTPTEPLINNYMNLVAKLAHNGEADLADGYELMDYAKAFRIAPSIITFNALVQVAASCSMRNKAVFSDSLAILQQMRSHNITPDLITFNTMLNALSACTSGTNSQKKKSTL